LGYAVTHGRDAAVSLGFDSVFCYINLPFIDKSNKRYSKCGICVFVETLEILRTFVLADFEQQFNPSIAIPSAVGQNPETPDINT
jgi:hypothetical protein